MKKYSTVLSIAGSDSGGGAGIQADLKTFSAFGCYAATVITAVTAQNTIGVQAIYPVPADMVEKQLVSVFSDIEIDAVKIGMLFSAEMIEVVARVLKEYNVTNTVLDPVMVATSGDRLCTDESIKAMREFLIPEAALITPNLPEGEILLGKEITSINQKQAALEILSFGSGAVLLKGGHLPSATLTDVLALKSGAVTSHSHEKNATQNTHGTGCTLSSAIAAGLAQGLDMPQAVAKAFFYLKKAIAAGADYCLGKGHGPVNHMVKPDE